MKILAEKLLTPSYFTYVEASAPLAPDSITENGVYHFNWMTAFDVGVDVHFDSFEKIYIGAVTVKLSTPGVSGVEVLVDGKTVGGIFAEKGLADGGAGSKSTLLERNEITVSVGTYGSELLVRLHGAMQPIDIESISLFGAELDEAPTLWPAPKKVAFLGENRRIKAVTAEGGAEAEFAKDFFLETLKECSPVPMCDCGITVRFKDKEMQKHYVDKYVATTGARRPLKKAKEKVKYPWSGMNYSQRIAKNSQQMNQQVIQGIENILRKGGNKTQVISLLLELSNKYSDRHNILTRTEIWHMDLLGELDGMKTNKVRKVQYVTSGDDRVCPECVSLESYNDGIYLIEEAPILPRHPRCRCHLIPYDTI